MLSPSYINVNCSLMEAYLYTYNIVADIKERKNSPHCGAIKMNHQPFGWIKCN